MNHGDSLKLEVATKKPSSDELAESIYQEYPRKVGKSSALTAIKKSLKTHASEFLLERVKAYASAIGWKDRQFIPHPATWFNGGRFNDDPAEWEPPSQSSIPQPIETAETAEMMASLESVLQTMRPGWDTMLSYAERQAMMMNARCLLNVKPDGWASMKRYLAAKLPEGSPGYQPRSRLKFIENLPDVHGQAVDWDRKQRRCTPIPAPPVTPRATISRAELAEVFTKNGTSEPCNRSEP
jgi:hypothetical protein